MHVFKNEFLGFMRGCSGSTDKVGSIYMERLNTQRKLNINVKRKKIKI